MNLLSSASRVEAPFIKVTIGLYEFGYSEKKYNVDYSSFSQIGIKYPNYIKSIDIVKINGQVNQYTLKIDYIITENDDPNFFEKVFSSVNKTRKIVFSYGDMSVPTFMFKEEEAFLLKVIPSFDIQNSRISYTVTAVSKCTLSRVGSYTFPAETCRPSDRIRRLIYEENEKYGLLDVFTAMRDRKLVERLHLIPDDDVIVHLEMKVNISVLDYLLYLVSQMTDKLEDSLFKSIYLISYFDGSYIENDKEQLIGTYFKIVKCDNKTEQKDAYELDIGYMSSKNPVLSFNVDVDNTYSLYYEYQQELNDAGYVWRISNRGEYEEIYAPVISSGNDEFHTREEDKTYWASLTQFPIKASITLKGLIRQPMLMSYLRLNILFFGKKYIYSGLYIITKQQDSVSESGFTTTLNMVRVAGDDKHSVF